MEFGTSEADLSGNDSMFNSILMSQIFGKDGEEEEDSAISVSKPLEKSSCVRLVAQNSTDFCAFDTFMQEDIIDLNIVVERNIIGVHQLVLAAHSALLHHILLQVKAELGAEGGPLISDQNIVERVAFILPEYSIKVVTKVVHFLYSGELIYSTADLQEMNQLADDLELKYLKKQLTQLKEQTREETVVSLEYNLKTDKAEAEHHPAPQQQQVTFITCGNIISIGGELNDSCEIVIGQEQSEHFQGNESVTLIGHNNAMRNLVGSKPDDFTTEEAIMMVEGDLETPVQSPADSLVHSPPGASDGNLTSDIEHCQFILSDISQCTQDLQNIIQSESDLGIQPEPTYMFDGDRESSVISCNVCRQGFQSLTERNNHSEMTGCTPASVYDDLQCGVCKNFFNTQENLLEHRRTVHEGKAFSCEICSKTFTRSHHLKVHKRIHTGEKPYPCTECSKAFFDNSSLKHHMKIHSDEYGFKCGVCEKRFKLKNNMRQHEQTHKQDRPYRCGVCSKGFAFKRNMLRHIEIHTQVNLTAKKHHQLLKCNYCHNIFNHEVQLLEHTRSSHPDSIQASKSLVYRCWMRTCNKVFPTEDLLNTHQNIVHQTLPAPTGPTSTIKHISQLETVDEQPPSLATTNVAEKPKSVEVTGPFFCTCGVTFGNAKTLRQHQKTSHTSVGPNKCTMCNKGFKHNCDLMKHVLEHTNSNKKHICGYCSKAWDRPSDLEKHLRVHTGEKPFQCDQCDKKFADSSLFRKHKRKHTGAVSYPCDQCSKSFLLPNNLEKHKLTHGLMSFMCVACSKIFFDETSLTAHINIHNPTNILQPFACSYCDKKFSRSYDMKKHERIHTKEKPYCCNQCGVSFSDSSSFKKHEKSHLKMLAS